MSEQRDPWTELIAGGRGRPPRFVAVVLIVVALGCVASTIPELIGAVEALRLSPAVWQRAELWRVVTYGWVGTGGLGPWTALQLVFLYWLAMELIAWTSARRVQVLLLLGVALAGVGAVAAQMASNAVGGPVCDHAPFWMMQGQTILIAIAVGAFSGLHRHATLAHTPFVLGMPIPSRWLIPLQLGTAALGFAATRDLGGLVGILIATVWGLHWARRGTARRS